MSDIDPDLQAILDGEDDDEDETPTAAQQDSSVITQMRQQLRAEKKARKAAEERLASVEPYREKYLTATAPEIVKAAGVDPSLSKLVVRDLGDGELTPERVTQWATENGVQVNAPEPEEPVTTAAEGNFAPTVGGEAPGRQKYDRAWTDDMMKQGRSAEVFNAIARGQVEFNNPEAQAQANEG